MNFKINVICPFRNVKFSKMACVQTTRISDLHFSIFTDYLNVRKLQMFNDSKLIVVLQCSKQTKCRIPNISNVPNSKNGERRFQHLQHLRFGHFTKTYVRKWFGVFLICFEIIWCIRSQE